MKVKLSQIIRHYYNGEGPSGQRGSVVNGAVANVEDPGDHQQHSNNNRKRDGKTNKNREETVALQQKQEALRNPDVADDHVGGGDQEGEEEGEEQRVGWGSQLEFLLSCLSFAVGLGNIWRFPYLCYRNGGGAFLIPYVCNIVLTGIPLFFLELAFGQFASKSPIAIWAISPLFQGIGFSMFVISVGIGLYYNVIIAWAFYYLSASLKSFYTGELPWTTCGNEWNSEHCRVIHNEAANFTLESHDNFTSAAQEYFSKNMLNISEGIEDMGELRPYLVLCLFVSWATIFVALWKGVQSFGKVVYFTAIFPYVILLALLVRGVTLPGAIDGISFYVTPKFDKLGEVQVWKDAAIQIFFSLGPCYGALITLASYNKFDNNCFRDAVTIAVANCLTSFFAGFVVFGFIGFMAYELDKSIDEVVESGPGLAFVVYPEAVSLLPASRIWAVAFFVMLLSLGLGTQFSIMETVVSVIVESWPRCLGKANHKVVLLSVCVLMFLGGLPMVTDAGMYVLQLMDNHAGTYSSLITGICELFVLGWVYGVDRFLCDIQVMFQWSTHSRFYKIFRIYWTFMWKFVTPIILGVIFAATLIDKKPMTYDKYLYPDWANLLGWMVSMASVSGIPAFMIAKLVFAEGTFKERFLALLSPTPEWGPRDRVHRKMAADSWEEEGFPFIGREDEEEEERGPIINAVA